MTQSNTDWVRLASGTQGEPTEEHPEAEVRHVVRGIVRQGLKPLPAKASVSLPDFKVLVRRADAR